MAVTTVRYGRYRTAAEADYGVMDGGDMRACVYAAASDNIWVYEAGIWAGRNTSTNVTARIGVYDTNSGNNPAGRVGYSASFTVSASKINTASGGASNTAAIAVADNAPTGSALRLVAGKTYALAILGTGAQLNHSMRAAGAITEANEQFYFRSGLSQPPPNPYGSYTSSTEGHITMWLTGEVNEAPETPSSGLAPSGSVESSAPTFTADFRDKNGAWGTSSGQGADRGDRLNQYQIQARAVGTTTLIWNTTYTASGAEITNNVVSRAYGGSTLTRGTQYEWRIRMTDQFGAWSAWSAWTSFTPALLGFVTADGNPFGKEEAISGTDLNFEGKWTHVNSKSTNRLQARILNSSGSVLQTGSEHTQTVTSSAAPGTAFTLTWANSGLSTLQWGRSYQYQLRGRDTDNVWSDWSTARAFTTNAAPTVPTGLAPSGGTKFTAYPKLTASWTDSDDTTATGLTGTFEITRPNASTVTATPTYNSTTRKWEFQTTATELNAFGTYSWRARSYDGTLYSGESTTTGGATWSASQTFQYVEGPAFTVDEPDDNDTIVTASTLVEWTLTSGGPQTKYRIQLYNDGTSTSVYDSGWVTSAATSHTIPSGYYRNGNSYDLVVSLQNNLNVEGSSPIVNIDVSYTAPAAPGNFQVQALAIGTDVAPTAIQLSWEESTVDEADFVEYTIQRTSTADNGTIILARLTSKATTSYIDPLPASGIEYTYTIRQLQQVGADQVESDPVSGTITVDLGATVLTLVGNPLTYRCYLPNVRERSASRIGDETVYQTLAGEKPVTVRARTRFWEMSIEAAVIADSVLSAAERRAELEALDQQSGTWCYRDSRGTKRFVTMTGLQLSDQHGGWTKAQFTLREEAITEGVE